MWSSCTTMWLAIVAIPLFITITFFVCFSALIYCFMFEKFKIDDYSGKICRIEESHWLFPSKNDPSFCVILLSYNNKKSKIHLFPTKLPSSTDDLHCFHMPKPFRLDTSVKTTFQITSSYLTGFWSKVDVILHLLLVDNIL